MMLLVDIAVPKVKLVKPSPNDLEYRVKLSKLECSDMEQYYEILEDEFKYRNKINYSKIILYGIWIVII